MSRTFAVSTGAENITIPTLAIPLSMAGWFKPGTHLGSTIFGLSRSIAGTGDWLVIAYDGSNVGFWEWALVGSGNDVLGPAGTPFVDGAWNHFACTATSLTSKTYYVNGVAGPTFTTSVDVPSNMNRTRINGAYFSGTTPSAYINGDVAMCTIWNGVALSSTEVGLLVNGGSGGNGRHPKSLRNAFIVDHYDVTGLDDPEFDTGAGLRHLTLSGSVPQGSVPPVDPLSRTFAERFQSVPLMR